MRSNVTLLINNVEDVAANITKVVLNLIAIKTAQAKQSKKKKQEEEGGAEDKNTELQGNWITQVTQIVGAEDDDLVEATAELGVDTYGVEAVSMQEVTWI